MATVINRTTLQLLRSVNTPDYDESSWIVDPDLTALASVPQKYWKIVDDEVLEMNQGEKDTADADLLIGASYADTDLKYRVQEYSSAGHIQKAIWYKTKTDGEYHDKVKETIYDYTKSVMNSYTDKTYDKAGNELTSKTTNLLSELNATTRRIIEET